MRSKQVLVACLLAWLTMHRVAAVINNGQTKNIEESPKSSSSEINENKHTITDTASDLKAESSENSNRREAIHKVSAIPSASGAHFDLPVPIYGAPNNLPNIIYSGLPPDTPPAPSKPITSLYGAYTYGKTYGIPQVNLFSSHSKGYNLNLNKYGVPLHHYNGVSTNLNPTKSFYGLQKQFYTPPGKTVKYPKYTPKNYGPRSPKPIYGTPLKFKDNFSNIKGVFNNNKYNSNILGPLYTNSFTTKQGFSNLYSGISSNSQQYGAPFSHYGVLGTGISTQNNIPEETIVPTAAYGPPQPSSNPRPPHPGAPAPPTPPDIKYDGWQPIPGLVSQQPSDPGYITADNTGYNNLSPPPIPNDHDQRFKNSYGLPSVTLDISHGTSLLDQPRLQDSYGVPLNSATGYKPGVSDSYGAPLGSVTGSGGVVASSGAEIHGGTAGLSNLNNHAGLQSLTLDLSSIDVGHDTNIQSTNSMEYKIPPKGLQESNTDLLFKPLESYGAALPNLISLDSVYQSKDPYDNNKNYIEKHNTQHHLYSGEKNSGLFTSTIGLVPPSGMYGVPQSGQYGTPLYLNHHGAYRFLKRPALHKGHGEFQSLPSNLYLSPPPSLQPGSYDTVPSSTNAISFQNVILDSPTKGLDTVKIENSANVPSSFIDLTQGKSSSVSYDCGLNNQQPQVSSLTYGVPSADVPTTSFSSITPNIATSQSHGISDLIGTQAQNSQLLQQQYDLPDLALSSSLKSEFEDNSNNVNKESNGKNYGKSVAESFGPNSELVVSQSIDLNNVPLQGNLESYTLQIQSADGSGSQVSHSQILNEGLLQSIFHAIEQPKSQSKTNKYPIILQPNNFFINDTSNYLSDSYSQGSKIEEVIVDGSKTNDVADLDNQDKEETLQLLNTSNIALYYKKEGEAQNSESDKKDDKENEKN